MSTQVQINPLVPPGSESLRQGDDRIRNLATWLLQVLGFTGTSVESFTSPFTISDIGAGLADVNADPITPLGIATAQYVGRKALYSQVTASGNTYIGSTTPTGPSTTPYDQQTVYIINFAGGDNPGAMSMNLNNGGATQLLRCDGVTTLKEGDIKGGSTYLVTWDSVNFRLMNFIGGSVPDPIALPANPTEALQAAPKQYVDTAIGHPQSVPVGNQGDIESTPKVLASLSVTIPSDGNTYLLLCSYSVWAVSIDSGHMSTWVDVGGQAFALASVEMNGAQTFALTSAAICPTTQTSTVTVTLYASTFTSIMAVQEGSSFAPSAPSSSLNVTVLRTTA